VWVGYSWITLKKEEKTLRRPSYDGSYLSESVKKKEKHGMQYSGWCFFRDDSDV